MKNIFQKLTLAMLPVQAYQVLAVVQTVVNLLPVLKKTLHHLVVLVAHLLPSTFTNGRMNGNMMITITGMLVQAVLKRKIAPLTQWVNLKILI